MAVPFVDPAGVIAGDHSKWRIPHHHNRDHLPESLYPTVKAIKALLSKENVVYAFDFHDPCHIGPGKLPCHWTGLRKGDQAFPPINLAVEIMSDP